MLGARFSQAAEVVFGWEDHFASSPASAVRESLCYVGTPVRIDGDYVNEMVWYGEPQRVRRGVAAVAIAVLFRAMQAGRSALTFSEMEREIAAYVDDPGLDARPDRSLSSLIKSGAIDHEGGSFRLAIRHDPPTRG